MKPFGALISEIGIQMQNLTLTHWCRVTYICVGKLTIIGSDNGLSPGRRQAIFWTNAGILLIGPLGTNFSEILIGIVPSENAFENVVCEMASISVVVFCVKNVVVVYAVAKKSRHFVHGTVDKCEISPWFTKTSYTPGTPFTNMD